MNVLFVCENIAMEKKETAIRYNKIEILFKLDIIFHVAFFAVNNL